MNTKTLTIGLLAAAAACATSASARQEEREDPRVTKALAGKIAGKPQSCLSLRTAGSSRTFNGAVLYRVNRNLTWRNDMNGCPSLNNDRIQIVRVFGSQLCRGDIVSFADRGTGAQFGSCAIGDFVPYRTP